MPLGVTRVTLVTMWLATLELFGAGALSGVKVAFGDEPRPLTVLFGADGVGKTTVLGAIASTRPGHALPIIPRRARADDEAPREIPFAITEWMLGDDEPERPHALRVASPNAQLGDDEGALRRREQALFDKRAQDRGGYAFAAFSGARWFSRTPVLLATPERTVIRYDVRAPHSFDDASRSDLTRETKQVLSFAAIASALEKDQQGDRELTALDTALRDVASIALAPFHAQYDGVHPRTLEPIFSVEGRDAIFEELPRGARHLLAIVTGAVRVLHGAYLDSERPVRERQGVVLVDDLEAQQDAAILRHFPALLKASLPRVQWIVATSAAAVTLGCERDEVIALRREPEEGRVVVHEGAFAVLH